MSSTGRRNPAESQITVTEIEELFAVQGQTGAPLGSRWVLSRRAHFWRPPTDLYETDDFYIVQVEIAGMSPSNFNLALSGRHLTITGHRQDSGARRAYYQMEIHYGEFRTDLELPEPFTVQGIQATYRDGFLRVVLPKSSAHPPAEHP